MPEVQHHRENNECKTLVVKTAENRTLAYSLQVAQKYNLHFSCQTDRIDGIELLGIPIEKIRQNRFTQTMMIKQLIISIKTWGKAKEHIKSNHARFYILNICLRTRFHHFCRGIRPSKMGGSIEPTVDYLK